MKKPGSFTHHTIFKHPEHCINQIAMRVLKNGDLLAVFNEERFPFHHDSGQTLMANVILGARIGGTSGPCVRPYVVAGIGLMRDYFAQAEERVAPGAVSVPAGLVVRFHD